MIKTLLFDADGVLFFHAQKLFSERLAAEYGTDPAKLNVFFETTFPYAITGQRDLKQELGIVMADWGWTGTVDELMDYWYTYEHDIDEPLMAYIINARNRGVRSYVATNNDHYRAEWLFEQLNINEKVFSKLYAAGDLGVAKPQQAFFDYIVADLDLPPNDILFWDDTLGHVEAARGFGFKAELYTDFESFITTMKAYE